MLGKMQSLRSSKNSGEEQILGQQAAAGRHSPLRKAAIVLLGILLLLVVLQSFLPLRTAIKIGADEDFEFAKVTLCIKGYKLYTEIWDDQPPLYTSLLTRVVKWSDGMAHKRAQGKVGSQSGEKTERASTRGGHSVLEVRLLTTLFAALLLTSFYGAVFTVHQKGVAASAGSISLSAEKGIFNMAGRAPLLVGGIASIFLIGSPGFLEVSSSCMQEVPALAPIVASIALLLMFPRSRGHLAYGPRHVTEVLAGLLFAVGLQMKLIGVVYLPIVLLALWIRGETQRIHLTESSPSYLGEGESLAKFRRLAISCLVFGLSVLVGFVLLNSMTGNPLLVQLQQAWASHFTSGKSLEYGSAEEHRFDWSVLLKNWDTSVPAVLGVVYCLRQIRAGCARGKVIPVVEIGLAETGSNEEGGPTSGTPSLLYLLVPVTWLGLMLCVFGLHKPWWPYYYVHTAIPLSWCGGIGVAWVVQLMRSQVAGWNRSGERVGWRLLLAGLCGAWLLCALCWLGGRVYLEEKDIRATPKTFSSYVLKKIERYKPFTTFMFTDQPVYSFHASIPLPPRLAMLPFKRMWIGDMTNARLAAELESVKPGIILLRNDSQGLPFQDLLMREYQVVYFDKANRLFAHKSIARKGQVFSGE